jgi:DNA gyrase subunit A
MLPVEEFLEGHFVFMATLRGTVKKVPLEQFSRIRSSGLIALDLNEDDKLVGAAITNGSCDVMMLSNGGKAIRFKETDVRAMGRTARGVRGIRLANDQHVISLIIPDDNAHILTASEKGYGKRSQVNDFRLIGRGGQGVIAKERIRENCSNGTFLTVPRSVAMKTKCPSRNSSTGNMAVMFSPSISGKIFTTGRPRDVRLACGLLALVEI